MRRFPAVLALAVAMTAAPSWATACAMYRPWDPQDVRDADAVVVGRVSGYRVVLDQEGRRRNREIMARDPEMAAILGRGEPRGLLSDVASFDLRVDQVLVGSVPRRMRVRWDPSTFGSPDEMPDGRYLVALRVPGPDARDPSAFMVFRQPCSGAFLLPGGSPDAVAVLRVLAGKPPYPPGPPPPPESPASAGPAPAAELPAPPRDDEADRRFWNEVPMAYRVMLGGAGLGLLIAFGALAWRRRKTDAPD